MYFIRRCWFLKCSEEIHYVPVGAGDMWYYVPVDDCWEEVLGRNVYIKLFFFFKGLVAVATLFIYFVFFNTCIPNHIHTMIPYIHPSPFAEASLHFLIALVLSGENLPVVPSRESNSGLPSSKATRYQLSHAAPWLSHAAPLYITSQYFSPNAKYLTPNNRQQHTTTVHNSTGT